MGKVIKNKMRGMNLWAKVGMILLVTMLFSTFMYQGWYKPKTSEAVAGINAWTAAGGATLTLSGSGPYTGTAASNFAVGTGSNRVLVAAVNVGHATTAAVSAVTVSYNSVAMTRAGAADTTTSTYNHTYIYYLVETGNSASFDGATHPFTVTATGGTVTFIDAYYATLTGIDQTTPLGAGTNPTANRYGITGSTAAFTTGLDMKMNEQPVIMYGTYRSGSTPTITWPTNWGTSASPSNGISTLAVTSGTARHTSYAGGRTLLAADALANTVSTTAGNSANVTSMTAASFRPYVSAITTTLATGSMGTTSNATVYQTDTNKPVGSFTLSASGGGDTVSGLVVSGGTYLTTANVSAVKIWADTNGNGVLDAGEITTPIATQATIASNTATFSGLSLAIASGATNSYIITYDIGTAPANGNTLTAYVSSFSPGGNAAGTDVADSTLTISTNKTTAGMPILTALGNDKILVSMPYTLDSNANNTYTLDYGPTATGTWTNFVTGAAHATSPARNTITGLSPGGTYYVQATYADADGIVGTGTQVVGPITLDATSWSVLNDTNPNASALVAGAGANGRSAFPYTVSAGSNRLVLVAVEVTNGSSVTAALNSYAVSLGGVSLTKISGTDDGVTTNRAGLYLGYIKESSIPAGANYVDFSTTAASAFTSFKVMASTYTGIDQSSPLNGTASLSYSSSSATVSTGISIPGTGTYSTGDRPIFVMGSSVAEASLTSIASAPTAGVYTNLTNGIFGSANLGMLAVSDRTIPVASGQDTGVAVTWPSPGRPAVIGAVLRTYVTNTIVGTVTAVNSTHQSITVNAPYTGDGNGDNTVLVEWQIAGSGWSNPSSSGAPAHISSYTIPNLTVGGIYDVRVTYTDPDGVSGTAVQTISNVQVTEINTIVLAGAVTTPTPFTIAFSMSYNYDSNANNTYTVDYKLSTAGSWTNFITGAAHIASSYEATISGLLPDTNYDVRLTFVDADGVTGTNPQSFTTVHTPAENRTYPGVASATANGNTSIDFSMPFTYDMNNDNTYTVEYRDTGSTGVWTSVASSATHQASPYTGTITGRIPGKSYDVRMTYNDTDGFAGSNAAIQTATVQMPIDGTTTGAMTLTQSDIQMVVNVAYINDTNGNNTCVITYGTDGISYSAVTGDITVDRTAKTYSTTVTGLSPSIKYYFKALFTDADGVTGTNPVIASKSTDKTWSNNKMLHNSTNMGSTMWTANGGWGIPGGKYDAFTCNTCHIPNTSNIKLVRSSIDATGFTKTVVYKNVTSAGHDDRTVKTSSTNPCEVCHTQTKYHRYDATTNTGGTTHKNGTVCNGCHPHSAGFAVVMTNCIGCHDKAQGTRSIITTEFGLAYGHKKSGRGTVTNEDCLVCHVQTNHTSGQIYLRDPDGAGDTPITDISGNPFSFTKFEISYAAGSRTSTGHLSNTDVANVITQKFCLACHDSNGATNPKAKTSTGTAFMPFGGVNLGATYTTTNGAAAAGGLIDVKKQFATTNSSKHPVMGPNSRAYPSSTRLIAPYNNIGTTRDANTAAANTATARVKADSVVLNCFDCHTTGTSLTNRTIIAHGNAAELRGTFFVSSPTLCLACHGNAVAYTTSSQHGAGSAFTTGNSNIGTNTTTCNNCHFSSNTLPARPIPGFDIHGFNGLLATGGAWTYGNGNGIRPVAFMRNVARWSTTSPRPYVATGITAGASNCGGSAALGTGCSNQNHNAYSPGGSY